MPAWNPKLLMQSDYLDKHFPVEEDVSSSSSSSSSSSEATKKLVDSQEDLMLKNTLLGLEQDRDPRGWLQGSMDYLGIGTALSWASETWTGKYISWLSQQVHREPSAAHNSKYQLALDTQRRSLQDWLIHNPKYLKKKISDLLQHLRAIYQESESSQSYSELERKFVADAIQAIETLFKTEKDFSLVREHNRVFLTFLRDALQSDYYKDLRFQEIAQILREICWAKFRLNVMTKYAENLLGLAIIDAPVQSFTAENIAKGIEDGNKKLENCNESLRKALGDLLYQKLTNELDVFSDPIGTSNVPEIRSIHTVKDQASEYDVIYMRHGTPTYAPGFANLITRWTENIYWFLGWSASGSNDSNKANIIPEYRAFLDAAQEKGWPVLYVNHQNMCVKNSPEYNRSRAIEELQSEHPETFRFLALPFDGPIWKRIEDGNLLEWKARVLAAVTDQTDGFRLPRDFQKAGEFAAIQEKIHKLYFPHKQELSRKERIVFLSIFYSYIKEVVKAEYGIKIMVSACKDNKDRGNASSGIDEALFNLRLGKEDDSEALKDLYIRTLSPFIVKYEEILEHRLEPLLLLLKHIARLSVEDKQKIRGYLPVEGYKIVNQTVPYEKSPYSQLPEFITGS